MRRQLRYAATGLALIAAAGCATIPSSGTVHAGRVISALDPGPGFAQTVRGTFGGPTTDISRPQVVRGFLDTLAFGQTDIAREYLTEAATTRWHPPATITAYSDASIRVTPNGNAVTLRALALGRLTPSTGAWQPSRRRLTLKFGLAKVAGQWRITKPPSERLYTGQALSEEYSEFSLQFLNPTGTTVVPQSIVLARILGGGLATTLLHALLDGPRAAAAGAITTAIPAGTQSIGNVGLDTTGSIAEVDLTSQIRSLPAAKLPIAIAQIKQTLEQLPGITSVRIDVEGEPLVLPKPATAGQLEKPTSARLTAVLADGNARVAGSVTPALGRHWPKVSALALGPGHVAAGVAGPAGHERLLVGFPHDRPRTVLLGDAIGSVQYAGSSVVAVVDGTSVVSIRGHDVRHWQLPRAVTRVGVRALTVAPDGVRVALLVGEPGSVSPQIGEVTATARLVDLRRLGRPAGMLAGIAWGGESDVSVLSRAHGRSQITDSDAIGFSSHRLRAPGHGVATDICSNPDGSVAVVVAGELWVQSNGHWIRSGRATACS